MNEINTTRRELEALVKLIRHQGTLSEMYVGREILEITRTCPDWYDRSNDPIWNEALEAGALVRIGYILGQRAERERRKAGKRQFTKDRDPQRTELQ